MRGKLEGLELNWKFLSFPKNFHFTSKFSRYYELIQLSDKDPYFAIGQILQNHGVKRVATVEESLELAETEAAIVIVQNDQYDGHIVSDYCWLDTVLVGFLNV